MARDSRKNSAAESGMRGSMIRAPKSDGGPERPLLKNGACGMSISAAANGFTVSVDFPPKRGKDYEYVPPKSYVFGDSKQVAEFIEKELGVSDKE